MWHEARKHEKKLRGIMVDHKKRAERRKLYYDKIKKDPAEFLQVWGRQCKIHLDPAIAASADNPSIMTTWRGNSEVTIDRFDVRSHLDIIEDYEQKKSPLNNYENNEKILSNEIDEERKCNYERYRQLIQNEAADISEEQCLKEIEIEEKFGPAVDNSTNEKKSKEQKATIGYFYEDSTIVPGFNVNNNNNNNKKAIASKNETTKFPLNELMFDSDDDLEFDITIDIDKLDSEQKTILNKYACDYGLRYGDFVKMLQYESNERFALKQQKLVEAQKAQFSGRRSRRERRIEKEKRLKDRELSPLSYIAKDDINNKKLIKSSSSSSSSLSRNSSRSSSQKKKSKLDKRDSSSDLENKKNFIFITSYGNQDNQDNNLDTLNVNNNQIIKNRLSNINKNQLLTIKNLKSRRRSSSNSSTKSIKTAPTIIQQQNFKKFSDDNESEDEAIKEYLKRKQDRLAQSSTKKQTFSSSSSSNLNLNNYKSTSYKDKNDKLGEIQSQKEKLKKKMLKKINEQLKKDQKLEREKRIKNYEERKQREAELQYLSDKIRRRTKRSESRSRSRTRTRSRSRSKSKRSSRYYSRSYSRSPKRSKKSRSKSRSRSLSSRSSSSSSSSSRSRSSSTSSSSSSSSSSRSSRRRHRS